MEDSCPEGFHIKGLEVKVTNGSKDFTENEQTIQGQKSLLFEPNLGIMPSELLLKIFRFLPHNDLKNAIEVCRMFRDICTEPLLWGMFSVAATRISHVKGLDRLLAVLKLPRFSKLQILDLSRVNPPWKSKASADPSTFLEILTGATKLPLSWLDLSWNNLSSLSAPQYLAGLLNCVTNLALEDALMTLEQARTFMLDMSKDTKIKKLSIGRPIVDAHKFSDVFENLDAELVATALNNLEHLVYNKSNVHGICFHQTIAFLEVMGRGTRLKQLEMEAYNFNNLPPQVVAKAFNNLERFEMKALTSGKNLSRSQILAILQLMAEKTSLKFLMFEYRHLRDISWVNPELLARAVVQVEQVVINCALSSAQVRAISDLHHNHVSGGPKNVLEKAVNIMRDGGSVVIYQVEHMVFLWW